MKKEYLFEEWKDIKGYERLYEVSNMGRVKRLVGKNCMTERILKPAKDSKGYLRINLYKDGKYIRKSVHRLVAEAFIPNPDNLPCVNHKDENPHNNCVENLEWCTYEYNINYGTHNERMRLKKSKIVLQYDLNGNLIKEYPSTNEAERQTGFSNSYICKCCKGKYKQAYNYIWKYK